MMRFINAILITMLCVILSACGFHLRSGALLSPKLRRVYYAPENPYSNVAVRLRSMLKDMHVTFVSSPAMARYTVIVKNDHYSSSRAQAVNANLPSSITYTQTATIAIQNNKTQQVVASKDFLESQSLTLNANQIYVPNMEGSVKQTLAQTMQTSIYYWLVSEDMTKKLSYADKTKRTTIASK